jgi:8-oxo-dGTP pyrophosphatase MutT (NUDIX family)
MNDDFFFGQAETPDGVIGRKAMKAILLTPENEVLLLRICRPHNEDCFWISPGGGLEPGETPDACLRRELMEEVGLEEFAMGPLLWRRQHTFTWGEKRYCQRELYHAVHVPRFEPRMTDAVEARTLDQFRWWPLAELKRTHERLTPISLPHIVSDYLAAGPPAELPAVEVLTD